MLRRTMLMGAGGLGLSQVISTQALADKDPNIKDTCYRITASPQTEPWENASIGVVDPSNAQLPNNGGLNFVNTPLQPGFRYQWYANIAHLADCRDAQPPAGFAFELWVGNPAIAMAPNVNTVLINTDITTNLPTTASASSWFTPSNPAKWWTTGMNSSAVNGPGHRCMIVRCYPTGTTPDAGDFHLFDDFHVAQHNLAIASAKASNFQFALNTALPKQAKPGRVTLRATALRNPSREWLQRMQPALSRLGFQRPAVPPKGSFSLDLRNGRFSEQRSLTDAATESPAFEGIADFTAGVHDLVLRADLRSAKKGDAYIFRMTHVDTTGAIKGGLTVMAVVA